jgi:peptidoglycan biosynthesis protein MviN/MurJ (putative lipid II flippase)
MLIDSPVQPVIGAIFGLIPNSLTSIFLALAYVKGIISLPTLIAGLTSATGIGLYALMKYHKNNADNTLIMVILLLTAIGVGLFMYANMHIISLIQGYIH